MLPIILSPPTDLFTPPAQFTYRVTVTDGQATTPKFTFGAGAPPAKISWGDGSVLEAVTSTVELTHTYSSGGIYTVTLIMPAQRRYLTAIDINTDKVSWVYTPIQRLEKLGTFTLHHNLAWVQDLRSWQIPTSMQFFYIFLTGVQGDVSNWVLPTGLWDLEINDTGLSGDISAWTIGATMRFIWINGTQLTGCPVLSSMVAIQTIRARSLALTQAQVNLYLSRCVAREASTTYATPNLDLSLPNNSCPSSAGLTDVATLVAAGWVVDFVPGGATTMSVLGDSISATDGIADINKWPHKVAIVYHGGAVTLLNHAVDGSKIMHDGVQTDFDDQALAAAGDDADIIIMALGTNDDNAGNMTALQAEVEAKIIQLKASNTGATLYYLNVLPKWTNAGGGTIVDKSNIRTAIAAACTAQSITCWDTFSDPWIAAADTSDGTHPTAAGWTKIAVEVLAILP